MYDIWPDEFDTTSKQKFRTRKDTALPFLQANVALEEGVAEKASALNIFGTWKTDHDAVWFLCFVYNIIEHKMVGRNLAKESLMCVP